MMEDFSRNMMVGQSEPNIVSVLLGEADHRIKIPHFFSAEINEPKPGFRKMDEDNPRIQNRSAHSFWPPLPILFRIDLRGALTIVRDKAEEQRRITFGLTDDINLHNARIK